MVKNGFFSFVSYCLTGFGLGVAMMSLVLLLSGYSPSDLQNFSTFLSPTSALVLGWANIAHQLGAFFFPALLFYFFHRTSPMHALCFPSSTLLIIGAVSLLLGAGCIDWLSFLNLQLLQLSPALAEWAHSGEALQSQVQSALMQPTHASGWLQVILIIALLPAFFEELFFRGALFQWLLQWLSPSKVIVLTGFIFSLVHFQFEGFLPRWIMGMFLGLLAYKSQSLWPSILAHFFNNLSGIILFHTFHGSMVVPEDHWLSSPWWWLLSSILVLLLVYALFQLTKKPPLQENPPILPVNSAD